MEKMGGWADRRVGTSKKSWKCTPAHIPPPPTHTHTHTHQRKEKFNFLKLGIVGQKIRQSMMVLKVSTYLDDKNK